MKILAIDTSSKNAAVAIIPAAIMTDEEATICNVPEISDIDSLEEILNFLNDYHQ